MKSDTINFENHFIISNNLLSAFELIVSKSVRQDCSLIFVGQPHARACYRPEIFFFLSSKTFPLRVLQNLHLEIEEMCETNLSTY